MQLNRVQKIILAIGAVVMAFLLLRVPVYNSYRRSIDYVWSFGPYGDIEPSRLLVPVAAVAILTVAGLLIARTK